jgi:hypothetical protein
MNSSNSSIYSLCNDRTIPQQLRQKALAVSYTLFNLQHRCLTEDKAQRLRLAIGHVLVVQEILELVLAELELIAEVSQQTADSFLLEFVKHD